eukprot:3728552-Pyramimonas_sp.AAC.1
MRAARVLQESQKIQIDTNTQDDHNTHIAFKLGNNVAVTAPSLDELLAQAKELIYEKATLSAEQKIETFREQKTLQQKQKSQLNALIRVKELVDQVCPPAFATSQYLLTALHANSTLFRA